MGQEAYQVGEVIVFEDGEYSDKSYSGPFAISKAFVRKEVLEAYRAAVASSTSPALWDRTGDPQSFIAFLAKEGYIVDLPSTVWYLGGYDFKPDL